MPRLFVTDLDGTLVRTDGSIDPRDLAAIKRAQAAGISVTLATGRLATGALPVARALGLDAPLICADGSILACATTGAPLEQQAIDLEIVEASLRALVGHELAPFAFMHDVIHGDAADGALAVYVRHWTPSLMFHPDLLAGASWRKRGEVAMIFGIGPREGVLAAVEALERAFGEKLAIDRFSLHQGGPWALRAQPRGCSKGEALARLAARTEVGPESVAVIGDFWNDLSMFAWAGRSFAMGQAPETVRLAATDRLEATAETGGGVAEALERWMGD
ncbi:HAD hydrolase family protein [Polyangium aurulentum]|uniref:HAD hydrolase family protein n=1 Tax=Polyangium aurulentum TaxID=2567896 RepID=UPI00146F000E|nr:HAD hydrolase family protein [Polyangium aurulentum]UQA56392.1 HAD hydrolase family protein [Polyangium aurulentum]